MADDDWDQPSTTDATTTTNRPAFSSDNLDTNNNESNEKPGGFRTGGFGGNRDNNDNGGGSRGFGMNRRNNNDGDNNEGGGSRSFGGGGRGGGFGGGGRGGGFGGRYNNNSDEKRDFGGPRRNNDDNENGGNRRGGFGGGGGGGGFGGNRRSNDENGGGFGGGFRRNNDENGESGGGRSFGNRPPRNNDENGGERKGFGGGGSGFRRNNDENGGGGFGNRRNNDGEGRGFGGGGGSGFRRNNDENGGERKGFGGGGGFRRNNDENGGDGERRSFGGRRNNDENGEGGGRSFGGFSKRNNDENGGDGERKGFGGGFRKPRDGDDNNRNSGGGFGGGFRKRDDADGDRDNGGGGGRGGGFGMRNRDGAPGGRDRSSGGFRDRSSGGGGGGGFRDRSAPNRRDNNNNDEKAGGDGAAPREQYIPPAIEDNEQTLFDHTILAGINFKKQAEIPATLSGEGSDSMHPISNFKDAGLSELLLANIEKSSYEIPTPVQKYAIPIILQKRDLMACAQTGSGKTAAYLIPILTNILHDGIQSSELSTIQTPQALILSPTRELAVQIFSECKKFSYKSIIKSQILYGGTVTGYQMGELAKGTNILVATPGRLLDVIKRDRISLEKVKYIVLDEADRMLDFGFEPVVRDILSKCVMEKSQRNIFMFSATFPKEIQQLAQDFLQNYLFLTIGVVGGANTDVDQQIHKVEDHYKKREQLVEILNEIGSERTMIFVEQKKQADVLAFFLLQKGYPTTSIHGDRLQSQRETALRDFKQGESKIIVCTSVAARGLDISDVKYVINYDLPQTIDEYVHRIGRTGRCGNLGKSISFFSSDSENDRKLARNLVRILTQAGKEVPQWLNDAAEDCVGMANTKCTNDIRKIDKNFRSIAINDDEPAAAPATSSAGGGGDDDNWG